MESTSILNELLNPISENDGRIQGLVLGYVQSGKTSNMAGIIAKAADSGYKFIIIFNVSKKPMVIIIKGFKISIG